MSILITGGAGFIGSHITDELINNGYDVVIVDNLASGKKQNINPKAKFYEIDIRDSSLETVFNENEIEYVIHEAAQASVGVSTKEPVYDSAVNIMGSVNLLNLSKKYAIKKFIAASTAAVYGYPEYNPVDEKHPVKWLSCYGLSKYTMEHYIKLFGIDYIIFRYSNVYGPRQDAFGEAGVVAIFIERMTKGQSVEIHGDGTQTRDFIYVSDIANANLKAIQTEAKNMVINLSTNYETSVLDLFNTIKDLTGYPNSPVFTPPRDGDIYKSILDNNVARNILSWDPRIMLNEGILNTIKGV